MKKYLISLLLVMQSWNSFSQIDTTKVILNTDVARQVAIDLVEGDKAKEQVISLGEIINTQGEIISNQDSLILSLNKKILMENENLKIANEKLQQDQILQERLSGKINQSRALTIGFGTAAAVTTTIAILLAIIKG